MSQPTANIDLRTIKSKKTSVTTDNTDAKEKSKFNIQVVNRREYYDFNVNSYDEAIRRVKELERELSKKGYAVSVTTSTTV